MKELEKEILKRSPNFLLDKDSYRVLHENLYVSIVVLYYDYSNVYDVLIFKRDNPEYIEHISTCGYRDLLKEVQKAKIFCRGWMLARLSC